MNEALKKLVDLRIVQSKIQQEIEMLMPDAICEALKIVEECTVNNRIVYQDSHNRIVLVMRKKLCNHEDDVTLSRLDADIQAATAQLAQKYAVELEQIDAEIEQLQEAIASLETKREKLLSSRYISQLKKRYNNQLEKTAYFSPNLSVFIK
jgi:hypothetical protein